MSSDLLQPFPMNKEVMNKQIIEIHKIHLITITNVVVVFLYSAYLW